MQECRLRGPQLDSFLTRLLRQPLQAMGLTAEPESSVLDFARCAFGHHSMAPLMCEPEPGVRMLLCKHICSKLQEGAALDVWPMQACALRNATVAR